MNLACFRSSRHFWRWEAVSNCFQISRAESRQSGFLRNANILLQLYFVVLSEILSVSTGTDTLVAILPVMGQALTMQNWYPLQSELPLGCDGCRCATCHARIFSKGVPTALRTIPEQHAAKDHPKISCQFSVSGPLPVISRVITPLLVVITPVPHLQGHL